MLSTNIKKSKAGLSEIEAEYIAKSLIVYCPTVTAKQTNKEVTKLLEEHRDLVSIAVVEHNKPIGLINRNYLMALKTIKILVLYPSRDTPQLSVYEL